MKRTLLPPDHPDAPKYWMHETSGVLEPCVRAHLEGKPLTGDQVKLMKAYLWQWVRSPVWEGSGMLEALRLMVAAIQPEGHVRECIDAAAELDMDPL